MTAEVSFLHFTCWHKQSACQRIPGRAAPAPCLIRAILAQAGVKAHLQPGISSMKLKDDPCCPIMPRASLPRPASGRYGVGMFCPLFLLYGGSRRFRDPDGRTMGEGTTGARTTSGRLAELEPELARIAEAAG